MPAARADAPAAERSEVVVLAAVLGAGVVFAGVVWWVQHSLGTGDVLFHLGRARKLAEADSLSSLSVVNEFRDGGDHPGYAFPLWHAFLALVSRLAGVDVSLVVLHAGSALTPLAFGAAYAAGRAVLGHWAGGVAALAAQVAWVGFSRAGVGSFTSLALPATATRLLLVSILIALLFAYLREPSRRLLPPLVAAALAVAVVHPSYLVLVAIPLAGFAALALAVGPRRRDLAVRIGWAAGRGRRARGAVLRLALAVGLGLRVTPDGRGGAGPRARPLRGAAPGGRRRTPCRAGRDHPRAGRSCWRR